MNRMRGFTLLEALISLSFFLTVFLAGYASFWNQEMLYSGILPKTRAEEESNYRFETLAQGIRESASGLRQDALLEGIPVFFPDLQFGSAPTLDAFSVASVAGTPVPFRKVDTWYEVPAGAGIQPQNVCLIAGADELGNYSWNFIRITEAVNGTTVDRLRWLPLIERPSPQHGTLVRMNITGVRFRDGTFYQVNSSGNSSPFFDSLSEFSYSWNPPLLTIRWTAGPVNFSRRILI